MNIFYNFMEAFTKRGVPDLITVMGEVDNAIFNTCLFEEVLFHRRGSGNGIADGSPYCIFALENYNS
jgi:hypothetical protein